MLNKMHYYLLKMFYYKWRIHELITVVTIYEFSRHYSRSILIITDASCFVRQIPDTSVRPINHALKAIQQSSFIHQTKLTREIMADKIY